MIRTSTLVSALAIALSSTNAQIPNIPECATGPAVASFQESGCTDLSDFACICRNQDYISSLLPVIQEACSPEDLQATIDFTTDLCRNNGVPDFAVSTSSAATEEPTSTVSGAMSTASASGGSMNPGNSTNGGNPVSPGPSPQPNPPSGAMVGAQVSGVLGVAMGAMMVYGTMW
ncbi:MAG: hypothetical protein Q9174_005811, partial [Haloplaca sp. 1 TL-2023]